MNPTLLTALAVAAAYLIGAIPFGYLVFYRARGIDIRTVGSGNIGATNVGRHLGFRFFLFVFLLDMLKGFLPTWGLPRAALHWEGHEVPSLGVLVALAAILGHNFPVYLKFQGGKGVATSFGVLLALDWAASLAAVAGFLMTLGLSHYVSLSSLLGGMAFVAVHFARTPHPWQRDQIGMSLFSLTLLGLMIVRHRQNLGRIRQGTEPKVNFRKKSARPPAGRVSWALILVLVAGTLGAGFGLAVHASRRATATFGPFTLTEVDRAATGHQRAESLAFGDGGRLLAVTCPRYNRLVIYQVTGADALNKANDIELEGRPVAVAAARDRFYVLQRPPGDSRHVLPGWWETFDFQGRRIGSRYLVGFYPDDLALSPDETHAFVLTSGRAEGGANRPAPALNIVALGPDPASPRVVGRLTFDDRDDPARLALSASGLCAAVTLLGSNEVAAVDCGNAAAPRLLSRSPLPDRDVPYVSGTVNDAILMPVAGGSEALWINGPMASSLPRVEYMACTLPQGSGVRVYHAGTGRALGELTLRGALNLGRIKPTGLAYAPERALMAVANRSGGVHLIALRARADASNARNEVAARNQTSRR